MNPTRRILLIDDEPQLNSRDKIAAGVKDKLMVESLQIEVLSDEYLDGEARLDSGKVLQAIGDALKSRRYDLVLVDYNYGQEGFDGLAVIKYVRDGRYKGDLILYSANQKEIIKKAVGDNLKETPYDDIISSVNNLMEYRIDKIVSRPAMDSEVIRYLKTDTAFSPYGFIVNVLREVPEKVFMSCYPKLAGKKYGEIADMLDEGSNGMANEWLSAILEQLIVYLSEVNE